MDNILSLHETKTGQQIILFKACFIYKTLWTQLIWLIVDEKSLIIFILILATVMVYLLYMSYIKFGGNTVLLLGSYVHTQLNVTLQEMVHTNHKAMQSFFYSTKLNLLPAEFERTKLMFP